MKLIRGFAVFFTSEISTHALTACGPDEFIGFRRSQAAAEKLAAEYYDQGFGPKDLDGYNGSVQGRMRTSITPAIKVDKKIYAAVSLFESRPLVEEPTERRLILFLGRNTPGVLLDAQKAFPEAGQPLVISRDGDALTPPEGLEVVQVGDFVPNPTTGYTVIANGGTTTQSFQVVNRLMEAGVSFDLYDLQRDADPVKLM